MADKSPVDGILKSTPSPDAELPVLPEIGYLVVDLRETCWSEEEALALANTMDGVDEGHIHCFAFDFRDPGSPPIARGKPKEPSDE